ncbi:hypothetical protein [Nonomuraea sp. KM90]|uniref:hypothetical protein n=1 Tax=Nonomuraea sp. KM90 TaxID=3457428 RepID=UPI003FCD22E5
MAGALLAGAGAAPAAQADTATTTQAKAVQAGPKHNFGPIYSNGTESLPKESYFRGYWQKRGGNYYFSGDLGDRHNGDGDYSYVWFKYYDSSGFHRDVYRSDDRRRHFGEIRFKRDLKIRVCEGNTRNSGCGSYKDVF